LKSFDAGTLKAPKTLRTGSTVLTGKGQALVYINRAVAARPAQFTDTFEAADPIQTGGAILARLRRKDAIVGILFALIPLPSIYASAIEIPNKILARATVKARASGTLIDVIGTIESDKSV
jgi:hypothetical protein